MTFLLRFDRDQVSYWASRYSYSIDETLIEPISLRARAAGYLTKADFLELCYWKSPRILPQARRNSEAFIQAVTRTALSTPSEQLRVEVLTLLRGVGWPVASVILHFAHAEPYPILDFRALWSLNCEDIPYNFDYWWRFTQYCRQLAQECQVSMRVLDRALWQYSKENQG